MTCSLDTHPDGYTLARPEMLASGCCTCPIYACRHCDIADRSPSSSLAFGHNVCCFLESLPFVGCLTALFDRLCCNTASSSEIIPIDTDNRWYKPLSIEDAHTKMRKAFQQCVVEHGVYATDIELPPPVSIPFRLSILAHQILGTRKTQEDFYCIKGMASQGFFLGVIDGHQGKDIAQYIAYNAPTLFEESLKEHGPNIYTVFEKHAEEVQNRLMKIPQLATAAFEHQGAVAVFCFITLQGTIYTATIGDSEAFILRKSSKTQKYQLIPLSLIRNWENASERKRITQKEQKHPSAVLEPSHRVTRLIVEKHSLNISRAFGHIGLHKQEMQKTLLPKPEITEHQVGEGDRILLCSDGLLNISLYGITDFFNKNNDNSTALDALFTYFKTFGSCDNTTALLATVDKQTPPKEHAQK